ASSAPESFIKLVRQITGLAEVPKPNEGVAPARRFTEISPLVELENVRGCHINGDTDNMFYPRNFRGIHDGFKILSGKVRQLDLGVPAAPGVHAREVNATHLLEGMRLNFELARRDCFLPHSSLRMEIAHQPRGAIMKASDESLE